MRNENHKLKADLDEKNKIIDDLNKEIDNLNDELNNMKDSSMDTETRVTYLESEVNVWR